MAERSLSYLSVFFFGSDGTVTEYDLVTMTCIRVLRGHKGPVRDVQVSATSRCYKPGNDVWIWHLLLNKHTCTC